MSFVEQTKNRNEIFNIVLNARSCRHVDLVHKCSMLSTTGKREKKCVRTNTIGWCSCNNISTTTHWLNESHRNSKNSRRRRRSQKNENIFYVCWLIKNDLNWKSQTVEHRIDTQTKWTNDNEANWTNCEIHRSE